VFAYVSKINTSKFYLDRIEVKKVKAIRGFKKSKRLYKGKWTQGYGESE